MKYVFLLLFLIGCSFGDKGDTSKEKTKTMPPCKCVSIYGYEVFILSLDEDRQCEKECEKMRKREQCIERIK